MPGGHNGAAVSDPQDIKRNEDLARAVPKTTIEVAESLACKEAAHNMVGLAALDAFSVQCDPTLEAGQQSDSRAREGQGPLPVSPAAQNTVGLAALDAFSVQCDPSRKGGRHDGG